MNKWDKLSPQTVSLHLFWIYCQHWPRSSYDYFVLCAKYDRIHPPPTTQ